MRDRNTILIDELLSISNFLDDSIKDISLINEDIETINKFIMILVDGGYMTQEDFNEFMQENPITDVFYTIYSHIIDYELPAEFYKLVPRNVYIYTKESLKKKLDETLKEKTRTIGFWKSWGDYIWINIFHHLY